MKNALFIVVACGLLAFSAAAQKATDFSGTWELDASKSKLDGFSPKSVTLAVTQSAKDLKIARRSPNDLSPGTFETGEGSVTVVSTGPENYALDGKETETGVNSPMGSLRVVRRAKVEDGKLKLSTSFIDGMGDSVSNEVWSLSADGKVLTIVSSFDTPEGVKSSTMVFKKK